MRAGGVERSLGEEAAAVVRQATSMARRRGHEKVTPLHVTSALLSGGGGGGGLLRAACVRSQSDPLQCNALELCLSVVLDHRPPWSVTHLDGGGGGGGGDRVPAPSNAFAAAIKRAQANQRRGSADGGHGQRLALKVELKHLVISILDDPSVNRLMREVGLSSSQVKANVQDAVTSDRTGSDRSIPYPICNNITSTRHPSLENVTELHQLHDQGSLSCITRTRQPSLESVPELHELHDHESFTSISGGQEKSEILAENLRIMCGALEMRLPRRRDIVPAISTTVLRCRVGMSTKRSSSEPSTPATWMLFRGRDEAGKMEMAKELARFVFGSYVEFVMVSSDPATSSDQLSRNRRHRSWGDGDGDGLVGARLLDAILENPHRVIMVSGVSRLDHESEIRMRSAVADGTMRRYNGHVVSLEDAIVVLSSQLFTSSPPVKLRRRFSLDLNAHAEECEREKDDSDSGDDDMGFEDAMDGVFLFD